MLLLLLHFGSSANAKVHIHVINRLGDGRSMNIHCRSKDNDVGNVVLEDGFETEWSFSVNFWGTTLFYCNVRWDNSSWYHFDAYSDDRDHKRCHSECRWMISNEGSLFGYDQEHDQWELFPLKTM
ncbi:hypothetical protein I3843_13G112600 [Carya illinoinensis]|uniref:S-protein homolog n=1 Tax=Carya illinoinensis TaxID=32201 RepID=A0A8T1NK61_CARIL|nr:hypothetical protein I3760_13G127200 [Carya illinoinensis]KAG6632009.1 hypothetical protein CIPAW_13G128600 [Carya illinoinensis]KAG6682213.1 hypothetical protein I3842_13G127000 [Carya illinoinensis]KAG7950439.1 hypothetical protein I3843_13G112600 [Carya illinoinensis]